METSTCLDSVLEPEARRHCGVASTDICRGTYGPPGLQPTHLTPKVAGASLRIGWSQGPLGACVSVTMVAYIRAIAELSPRGSIMRHLNCEEKLQLALVPFLAMVGRHLRVIRTCRVCLVRMPLPNKTTTPQYRSA